MQHNLSLYNTKLKCRAIATSAIAMLLAVAVHIPLSNVGYEDTRLSEKSSKFA